ncbi:MAG TPA: polysaccharide pyruvyl transferase family protein [Solirubrobacteraceae bacterium]|nr:polysaccharide pyruvyl transferase family protein [Solirubrobacteraceae bacterium]
MDPTRVPPDTTSTTLADTSATLVETLRQGYAETLDRLLPPGSQVVLLDYPTHENIGDHVIWLGQTAYLGSRDDLSVHFISDRFNYSHGSLSRHLPADAIVLFSGGGNFGDIYPQMQRMREAVIEHFTHNRFIQLPQTVSYEGRDTVRTTAATMSRHPDFTLLARDQQSLEFASETLPCKVELCVDSAFALGAQLRTARADRPIMWIARRDSESVHVPTDLPPEVEVFDWGDIKRDPRAWKIGYQRRRAWAGGLATLSAYGKSSKHVSDRLVHAFDRSSWTHVRAGLERLSHAQVLVTDRLHGHIMATLLDIPHVLLDNADSKLKRFYDTWTHPAANVRWAENPAQALELAQAFSDERASTVSR